MGKLNGRNFWEKQQVSEWWQDQQQEQKQEQEEIESGNKESTWECKEESSSTRTTRQ